MSGVTNWLILRGLSREKRQWGRFPEVFEARAPGVQTHRLDLPGVAEASGRPAPLTVEAMVDDLRERFRAVRAAHPAGRWGLLGVSLGGMVTLAWLHRHPEDFVAGAVVNSSAGNLSFPQDRLRPTNLPVILRAARAKDPVERELTLLGMTTARHGENREIAGEWATYLAEHPLTTRVLARQVVAGMRFRAPRHLEVPLLVVSGAKDRFVAPRCSERLAARFSAPHVVHPEAGHDLPLDEPEWLTDELLRFAGGDRLEAAG